MDLYAKLKLTPIRTEPDLWVRRVAFFKTITPEPVRIRKDVLLSKGVNIVWAEETEDDNASAEITGHSVGKTTFCRFLRYILGETTFGTKKNVELIRKAFPQGYVGAELVIKQKLWAVLRPIGKAHASRVMADATLEKLLKGEGETAFSADYEKKIGLDNLLDGIESAQIVKTGEPIQWRQVLAWCARDQEARFRNIHEWRSPDSDSETPAFNFPKGGPLFVMRAILGLFLPEELKCEEEMAGRQRSEKAFATELEGLEREPRFRKNLYTDEMRKCLRSLLPEQTDLHILPFHTDDMLPDLNKLTSKVTPDTELIIAGKLKEFDAKQIEIDEINGRILQLQQEMAQFDTTFGLDDAASSDGAKEREQERQLFTKFKTKDCALGGVAYSDCEYVKRRQQRLRVTAFQDALQIQQRKEEQNRIAAQKQQIAEEITKLKSERELCRAARTQLNTEATQKRETLTALIAARDELSLWIQRLEKKLPYKDLDDCRKKITENSGAIRDLEVKLEGLIKEHKVNRALLESVFSAAVNEVLPSGTYSGSVTLTDRQIGFAITHGPAMSGEAVQTLAILLADAVSVIFSTVSPIARMPGFLLHDSPREADLGLRIYHAFLKFMVAVQKHFEANICPFQYIVTTTTPPPKGMRKKPFVKLKLGGTSERLLKCNIAEAATLVEEESAKFNSRDLFDKKD